MDNNYHQIYHSDSLYGIRQSLVTSFCASENADNFKSVCAEPSQMTTLIRTLGGTDICTVSCYVSSQ
jgi:hypothetical protein